MTDLPEPLTPPDCDLRHLQWFPLNVTKLLSSELFATERYAVIGMCLRLWVIAWHQVPAASLPNDQHVLAKFLGLDSNKWRRNEKKCLRGFILCSDNRLYHRVLSEQANEAYRRSLIQSQNRILATERKRKQRARLNGHADVTRDTEIPVTHMSRVTVATDSEMSRVETGHKGQSLSTGDSSPSLIENPSFDFSRSAQNSVTRDTASKPARGTRWEPDAVIPVEWREEARNKRLEHSLSEIDLDLQAETFANYWSAKSGAQATKIDWHRTWINWALNAKELTNGARRESPYETFARSALRVSQRT